MQKIIPFLWFDDQAEEAAKLYTSIFKNSKIGKISRYGKEGYEIHRRPAGTVMTVEFEIEGQKFTALNGGPQIQIHRSGIILGRLQDTGRSGQSLEEADRGWRGRSVWLAQGQIRFVLADYSHSLGRDVAGQRSEESWTSHAGNAQDEEDRHQNPEEGLRGLTYPG